MASVESVIKPHEENLIWVDMEMSGLDPDQNRILEIAVVVTSPQLELLAEGPVLVVHQTEAHLATMDSWNKGTHTRSGLVDRVKASPLSESQVEQTMLDFLKAFVPAGKSPMCGNTIHQDRRFLLRYMPRLEAYFHYRNIDVSTIKELCRRWRPELLKGFTKKGAHTALADILESIEELRYYRKHLMPQTYSDSVRT
jgi:oligoribonuclease